MQEEKQKTVTMLFPRPVRLTLTHDKFVSFREGVQEVPAEIAGHWYLKKHGVKPYAPAAPLPTLAAPGTPSEGGEGGDDNEAPSERPNRKKRN